MDSDEDEDEPVPSKKHKKLKTKEEGRHKKEKGEEGKKKRGKRERKTETSEDEAAALLEDDLSDGPSEMDTSADAAKTPPEKHKQKKGRCEVKLQGIQDFLQDRKKKRSDPSLKDGGLQKPKGPASKSKDEAAPHSDSSDSSTLHKKSRSKGQDGAPSKAPSSTASSSSSSKGKDEELVKEEVLGQRDGAGSTNLFEKFLLNCEAKDRVPRRQPAHQAAAEKSSKPPKVRAPPLRRGSTLAAFRRLRLRSFVS